MSVDSVVIDLTSLADPSGVSFHGEPVITQADDMLV